MGGGSMVVRLVLIFTILSVASSIDDKCAACNAVAVKSRFFSLSSSSCFPFLQFENWNSGSCKKRKKETLFMESNLIPVSNGTLQEELELGLSNVRFLIHKLFNFAKSIHCISFWFKFGRFNFPGKAQKPFGYETPIGLNRSTERKGNRLQVLPGLPPPLSLNAHSFTQ